MAARSAAILLYRKADAGTAPEVLLVHPGGPLWARRDLGAWSIPKGEYDEREDPLAAARREFHEELGTAAPEHAVALDLGEIRQNSGKLVRAWAVPGELDADAITSNTFELEWPPRSGRLQIFPEVDRAAWFTLPEARRRVIPAQIPLLDRFEQGLA